jgi:hypothetical protein
MPVGNSDTYMGLSFRAVAYTSHDVVWMAFRTSEGDETSQQQFKWVL